MPLSKRNQRKERRKGECTNETRRSDAHSYYKPIINVRTPPFRGGVRFAPASGSASHGTGTDCHAMPVGVHDQTSSTNTRDHTSKRIAFLPPCLRISLTLQKVISTFSLLLSDFLRAHRSGNSVPLRPTRLLLCRFRPQHRRVPSHNANASLRLHAPSLFVVPQRKRAERR